VAGSVVPQDETCRCSADLAQSGGPAERGDALVDVLDDTRVLDGRDGARGDGQPRRRRLAMHGGAWGRVEGIW